MNIKIKMNLEKYIKYFFLLKKKIPLFDFIFHDLEIS